MSEEGEKLKAVSIQGSAALSDEAIDWLVRLSSGRASPTDREAFLAWRGQSAEHEAAAAEAEAILRGVAGTRQADRLRHGSQPVPFRAPPSPVSRRFLFAGGAAAAASAAVAVVGLNALGPLSSLYADHATGIGERRRIALDDGSTVTLNTATALSVDYSGQQRRVVLHDGEALFEVAKDPNRPFVVVAGNGEVRAVGTAFVVRRKDKCEHVTVTEGIVEVTVGRAAPVRLEVGQRLGFGNGDQQNIRTVDVDALTAWQRGKLIFNRRPLQGVVAEMQRYHRGRIVVANEKLKTLQVTGVFDLADLDHLLRSVEETTKAQVIRMPMLTLIL